MCYFLFKKLSLGLGSLCLLLTEAMLSAGLVRSAAADPAAPSCLSLRVPVCMPSAERERERERDRSSPGGIYIYIYISRERERERDCVGPSISPPPSEVLRALLQ